MLNQKRDYTDSNENKNIHSCFQILKTIIYNDEQEKIVKNMEAFKVLLSLISTSQQLMTVSESLVLLNEILGANIRNCLIFLKVMGFLDLHILLLRLLFPEKDFETLLKSNFCTKNKIEKLTSLYYCKYVKKKEIVDTKILGESVTKISETFETISILESNRVNLFTLLDQLIMSLCYVLNPLNIMPCAQIYSQIISLPETNSQFYKCLVDRLESMIIEKLTKVNVQDYEESTYCSDLELTLANLMTALKYLHKSNKELFVNLLTVFHKYLLFTAFLRVYEKPNDKSHLITIFDNFPDTLEFLNGLLNDEFADNPLYTEIVYSLIELIIYCSHPCSPVITFIKDLLEKSSEWKYQDLLLLSAGLCSSPHTAEAVVEDNKDLLHLRKPQLTSIFIVYVLCRDSEKNKALFESRINSLEFVKDLAFNQMKEEEQWFVLLIFRSLVNSITEVNDIDYSVLVKDMKEKDIELINEMRNKINKEYKERIEKRKKTEEFTVRLQVPNLRNILMILVTEASLTLQPKILDLLADDLNRSLISCNEWMNSEINDFLLELLTYLEKDENPLKKSYAKLMSRILSRGVSSAKTKLFYQLFESSYDFQQIVHDILEIEDLPLCLHISANSQKENEIDGVYTFPLKSFPREKVGFTIEYWAKFPFISNSNTLCEFVDAGKPIFSWKYISIAQSSDTEGEDRNDSRLSTKGGVQKYYFQLDTEGAEKKFELEFGLLKADRLCHVVMHYSKNSHIVYIDGERIQSITGTQNPYPMPFAKSIQFKLTTESKIISSVGIYEGVLDNAVITNLWFRGPLEQYGNVDKKLGIDLAKVYKFPVALKEMNKRLEEKIEKLVITPENSELEESKKLKSGNFSFIITTIQSVPEYLEKLVYLPNTEYQTPNTKKLKPNMQLYQCVGAAQVFLSHTFTLKQFLSSSAFIKLLIDRLSLNKPGEVPILLNIFTSLFIRNEGFVNSLKDIDLPSFLLTLSNYWRKKGTGYNTQQQCIQGALFDILFSYKDTLQTFNVFSKPNQLLIPTPNESRKLYFKALQYLIIISPQSQKDCMLNVLSVLLYKQKNMEKLFKEELELMLIYILKEIGETSKGPNNFMYEKLLEIFQLFFYWNHTLDWELLYSYFLLEKEKGTIESQKVAIDVLSIMSIYMIIGTNKVALVDKFVSTNGLKVDLIVIVGSLCSSLLF